MRRRVYKYLPFDSALKTIVGHKIKISEFADMNDPFELAGVVLSCRSVHKIIVNMAHENGALCMSHEWSNPLLWSHYADKLRGLCLGFEISPKVELLDLHYVDSVKEVSVEGFKKLAARRHLPGAQTPEAREAAKEPLMLPFHTKFKKWEYENEARILVTKELELKEGGLWFHRFDDDLKLCEVIVGARCSVPRTKLEDAVKNYAEQPRIFKVRLADASFELVEDPDGFAPGA